MGISSKYFNRGGSSNVVGFRLEEDHLTQIDHSLAFPCTNTAGATSSQLAQVPSSSL